MIHDVTFIYRLVTSSLGSTFLSFVLNMRKTWRELHKIVEGLCSKEDKMQQQQKGKRRGNNPPSLTCEAQFSGTTSVNVAKLI